MTPIQYFEVGLLVVLIVVGIIETANYNKFVTAAENLNRLGTTMEEAFKAVSLDIIGLNASQTGLESRMEAIDAATTKLNQNDALIEIYLNLFRDALSIKPELFSGVGPFEKPEPTV